MDERKFAMSAEDPPIQQAIEERRPREQNPWSAFGSEVRSILTASAHLLGISGLVEKGHDFQVHCREPRLHSANNWQFFTTTRTCRQEGGRGFRRVIYWRYLE